MKTESTGSREPSRESLRIGYLLKMYPRVTQTFVTNEILELERQGADLSILSLRLPNEGLFHESISRVSARAHYLPETHHGRLRKIGQEQWRLWRRQPGVYRRCLRLVRGHESVNWFQLAQAAYVLRWVKKHRIDHLHVHFGTEEATVALLAHMLGGVSFSMTLHAFDIFRDNVDRPLLARKINASRFTVTVSEYNRRFMVENLPGVNPDRIRVNYNGIDLDQFAPAHDDREAMTLFAVGRLIEKKGFIHLIRAVAKLRDDGVNVTCAIAGDGREEKKLQKAIDKASLQSAVTLLGGVTQAEVRRRLRRAQCFVLPCIQAKDGNVDALPTVLLESLASGCPSVSTRVSGVPEIIEDEVSGLLVEPGDDDALAAAIRRIIHDRALCDRLAIDGRRRAERRFDIHKNVAVMHRWLRNGTLGSIQDECAELSDRGAEPRHEPTILAEAS